MIGAMDIKESESVRCSTGIAHLRRNLGLEVLEASRDFLEDLRVSLRAGLAKFACGPIELPIHLHTHSCFAELLLGM